MPTNVVTQNQRLGKVYKLCSKKEIEKIFSEGKKLYKYPYSIHYILHQEEGKVPFELVSSVPKRLFKHAVKRNRIKRQMREAIRKNKLILESALQQKELRLRLFIVYTAKEEMKSAQLEKKTSDVFKELTKQL